MKRFIYDREFKTKKCTPKPSLTKSALPIISLKKFTQ